jgi:NADPH-dependent 2,4-dienoyl-CoA reductase/sulfur reductase-like enzyme
MRTVVVVGASLAGLRAAEALRRRGFDRRLLVIGEERHAPYDRPPLSKEILRGEWEPERIALRRQDDVGEALELKLGRRAVSLDARARVVELDDGERIGWDGLVVATGATPRRLWPDLDLEGVHVLRTLDDALALRRALAARPRVLVVGAGFIGAEVAASCRALGCPVTMVDPQAAPLAAAIGKEMAGICTAMHRDHGVDVRFGVSAAAVEGLGRVERVRLSDGSFVEADLVVVGIGVTPATAWLEGSGLALGDGVLCDESCAANVPGVVAAGDVARWYNRLFDQSMRVEHWSNAVAQGEAAAERLLAGTNGARPFAPVPTFWSDQYGVKLQFAGVPRPGAEVRIVDGSAADRKLVAVYGHEGVVVAVFAMRRARRFTELSEAVAARTPWSEMPPAVS